MKIFKKKKSSTEVSSGEKRNVWDRQSQPMTIYSNLFTKFPSFLPSGFMNCLVSFHNIVSKCFVISLCYCISPTPNAHTLALNNIGFKRIGLLIHKLFTVHYYKYISLPYNFLNKILFSLVCYMIRI